MDGEVYVVDDSMDTLPGARRPCCAVDEPLVCDCAAFGASGEPGDGAAVHSTLWPHEYASTAYSEATASCSLLHG